jgi:aminoglycoside phosphotransferase (APT) family kinase protein
VTLPHGISNNVEGWLVANINGATAPFAYTQIAGGHSNLTFKVDDAAGHSYVLRRPPLGHRLASAHDMGREHRIIAGLANSNVPVATARGLCTDENVNELPFYVMDFVDGHVVRDKATAEAILGPDGCRRASESIVDTMAAIHAVSPEAVGLGDLGRHEGYIARQLKRCERNVEDHLIVHVGIPMMRAAASNMFQSSCYRIGRPKRSAICHPLFVDQYVKTHRMR